MASLKPSQGLPVVFLPSNKGFARAALVERTVKPQDWVVASLFGLENGQLLHLIGLNPKGLTNILGVAISPPFLGFLRLIGSSLLRAWPNPPVPRIGLRP